MKLIKRIKVRDMVSAGVGQVLPENPIRPDLKFEWDVNGVLIHNARNDETILVPWFNIVEIVVEDYVEPEPEPEEKKPTRRGRKPKSE